MPIPLPELDDRTFDDLVAEGRALIPTLAPGWTNHNPADPGMVVLELLAWLTETVLYQLDQMPERNTETFLALLGGARQPGEPLGEAVRRTILSLRTLYRAVTPADYETLTATQWPASEQAQAVRAAGIEPAVARMVVVPRRNLEAPGAAARVAEAPGHLSVVVLPVSADPLPQAPPALCQGLWAFLDPRRLLTTRHHVVGPTYAPVQVSLSAYLRDDAPAPDALAGVVDALQAWFHPLRGGPDGRGWPFGRDVYVSEIDAELSRLPLVDFVEDITLAVAGAPDRTLREGTQVVGVALEAGELVDVRMGTVRVFATDGTPYPPPPPPPPRPNAPGQVRR